MAHSGTLFWMTLTLTRPPKIRLLVAVALTGLLTAFLLPPLRQPQEYHQFADQRNWLGIPNFLNVISNGGFLIVGIMGLAFLRRRHTAGADLGFVERRERIPYIVFFLGVFFTCFGSAFYHWQPNDSTLVWDRLPMTLVFMSLLAATICDRISLRAGLWLLGPLILAGVGSVEYWRWRGNLWPYAAVQYFSLPLLGLMMPLFPSRYTRSGDLLWVAALYALAKVFEALDASIFAATRFISGHTLKHLIAAGAVFWVLVMLSHRTARSNETSLTASAVEANTNRR